MKENKIAGVYKITNIITGDFYIGSSKDTKHRWTSHKSHSAWKQLPNSKLYKDMAKFGLDKFQFEIIEITDNLKEREQYWVDQLKPSYNVRRAKREIEDFEEAHKQRSKAWYNAHLDEYLAKGKAYRKRLCLYEGEILTLGVLDSRFRLKGISFPYAEAKKYLIDK